ncbi:MAG: TonB-dependent receptor [Roseivirga sp.]|jgi:TonB-linked SusC/RagA family outer membrane protein|uniref:SusC/RagA family TonB-linked outer membrane protein n=1 Tax=Roseivirga sp. TaxID=1964215 RepID=UPI001B1751D3|nr:TonB-dependent receptor [Roseivirga sp.]MBO6494237.1 TonB-dependent receptor [Roseivirga sp.]
MKKTLSSYFKVLPLLLLFALSQPLSAQTVQVSGTVLSAEDGQPLPSVTVREKGTNNGMTTDLDGKYRLQVSNNQAVLVFSFVGFVTQEVLVGNQTTINVTLSPNVSELGEIVVVGYGSQEQKDITSSISTVKSEEIAKVPTAQAMQALQGKVPGLQIVSSGAPGAAPTVRVRGVGSLEGNAAPLYVVDGMFFNSIDFLNTSDIASISVLKDASASAIYGVRASNGVILIETKSGSYNKPAEIVYNGYYGIQTAQNVLKVANAQQFTNYALATGSSADAAFIDNALQRFGRSRIDPNIPNVNTDWYGEVMESYAPQQNHTLSVNGGSDNTRYSLGVSYFKQDGLMKFTRNEYERVNLRSKIDYDVSENFRVGGNINISNGTQYVGENSVWFKSFFAVPILPVYDDLNTAASPNRFGNAQVLGYRGSQNPLFDLYYNDNRNKINKFLANFYAELDIIPETLKFRTAYNYSFSQVNSRNLNFDFNDGVTERVSSINRSHATSFNQISDNYLTFNKQFAGKHNVTAVAGYSYRSETSEGVFAGGTELFPSPSRLNEELWYISLTQTRDETAYGDYGSKLYGSSYFSRLAYNFDDRYLLYGTYRRDGNNKFQQKWGDFFTVGAGWVLTEEDFFDVSAVDFLKVRGGWGQLGNDGVAASVGEPTIDQRFVAIDGERVSGNVVIPTFDYVDRWETTEELNIGVSARMFNERLSVEADYFQRDTKDASVTIILPLIRSNVRRSAGSFRNEGFELALNWSDEIGDVRYSVGGNLATLNNEVLSLGGPQYLDAGSAEFRQRSIIGQPLQAFFGYETDGIFQNQSDIDNYGYTSEFVTDSGIEPGDYKFKDQNQDGVIDDQDRVVLGSYLPTLTYGFNFAVSYMNFDLSADFQGMSGHSILNRKRGEIIFTTDTNIDAELAENLWTGEGTSNKYPSAAGLRKGWNQSMSDYFVEDGSYFRIQNIRLSYNLINQTVLGTEIPETRITFTAEKPVTLFNYNGFNPEVANGIDRQTYPIPAVYTLGLNIKF